MNERIEDLTQEEQNAQYLQHNPHVEQKLWADWVVVVCGWYNISAPTEFEWVRLREGFYSGKAPIDSATELKAMRSLTVPPQ